MDPPIGGRPANMRRTIASVRADGGIEDHMPHAGARWRPAAPRTTDISSANVGQDKSLGAALLPASGSLRPEAGVGNPCPTYPMNPREGQPQNLTRLPKR